MDATPRIFDFGPKPFLRWVGGKQRIVPYLSKLLPTRISEARYLEPFLGAASLFLALKPQKSILSDLNEHLINTYLSIRQNPILVFDKLRKHAMNNSESYYYDIREKYRLGKFSASQAARFIYLNRACYNGVFRVNVKGQFNVPYGKKKNIVIPSKKYFLRISALLKNSTILTSSYENTVNYLKKMILCTLILHTRP